MLGALTVGVNDTGHNVKFFGATSGASFLYNASEDGLTITSSTDDAALQLYCISSGTPLGPQLKVGRDSSQYWGVYTEDTIAHLIHRQDETDSTSMHTYSEIWSNGTGNDTWQWKHGTNSGGSLATVMTLDKAGQLTVTGEIEGGSLDINGAADISGDLTLSGTAPTLRIQDARQLNNPDWDNVSLGNIEFYSSDTTSPGARVLAEIEAFSNGAAASGPNAELRFKTSSNTDSSSITRLTIGHDGASTFTGNVTITGGSDIFLADNGKTHYGACLLYTSPSPRD